MMKAWLAALMVVLLATPVLAQVMGSDGIMVLDAGKADKLKPKVLTPQVEEVLEAPAMPGSLERTELAPPSKTYTAIGGKTSYVPAPRSPEELAQVPVESLQADSKGEEAAEVAGAKEGGGQEICDVVAQLIARDFRVIITSTHSRSLDIPTIGRGPYDVAQKSIMPFAAVYDAMDCDGKALQYRVADKLRSDLQKQKEDAAAKKKLFTDTKE